jgi:gliding motility-associated-like protein
MQNGLTINNLCAGSITVTITDANNCTATNTTIITNTPGPTVQASMVSPENCGQSDGQGIANVLGGTNPIGYLWSNTQVTPNLTNVIGGNYTVVVTDANSCTASSSVVISIIGGPTATLQSVDALCDQPTGEVSVTPMGGIGVYSYLWDGGQNTGTISNLAPGIYCVTVTSGGCTTSECATIVNIPGPTAEFTASPTLLTIDQANCVITDQSVGATSWNWSFGDGSSESVQNPTHSYENTGDYMISLIVTDGNGCKDSTEHPVKVKGVYLFYIPNTFTPNGDGINDFFFPTGLNVDLSNFEMFIFDRWGKRMFYTKDISKPWNGTLNNEGKIDQIVMGIYVYKILTKDNVDGAKHEYVGRVTIIQ